VLLELLQGQVGQQVLLEWQLWQGVQGEWRWL